MDPVHQCVCNHLASMTIDNQLNLCFRGPVFQCVCDRSCVSSGLNDHVHPSVHSNTGRLPWGCLSAYDCLPPRELCPLDVSCSTSSNMFICFIVSVTLQLGCFAPIIDLISWWCLKKISLLKQIYLKGGRSRDQNKRVEIKRSVLKCPINFIPNSETQFCESRLVGLDVQHIIKCPSSPVAHHGLFDVWCKRWVLMLLGGKYQRLQ